jgi:hypothetical protein
MRGRLQQTQEEYYRGVPTIPYDLLKELTIALIVSLGLIVILASFLSSPDVKSETVQSWATADPVDFVTTATGELSGSTLSSNYGAPYNSGTGSVQGFGPISPQSWLGVHQPVDPPNDFVLTPLKVASANSGELAAALDTYNKADDKTRQGWLAGYQKALKDAKADSAGSFTVAQGDYGPLPVMMDNLRRQAQAGGLDGLLLSQGGFYQTDYTRPLLFMGDGGYLPGLASSQSLTGSQWGMMNETGMYPGQTWLWLYTLWYQVPPFLGSSNADLGVVLMMTLLSLGLLLVPFIPGLRDIPYWIPIHRLIWRVPPHHRAGAPPQPLPDPRPLLRS